eukprot:TRINITY_DN20116_c0_g1_i2.p2 TRINITY_DN20116_c0_g1~~TRINITY_DN20116_c0_g1_i2.p2  ORF type:complete len:102 (+),score=8.21 TRINITY_DN20116_c0_g1_i2:293-598(+)
MKYKEMMYHLFEFVQILFKVFKYTKNFLVFCFFFLNMREYRRVFFVFEKEFEFFRQLFEESLYPFFVFSLLQILRNKIEIQKMKNVFSFPRKLLYKKYIVC